MMPDNLPPRQHATALTSPEGSYVDWPAIFAGGVFALAFSFLLISFGAGLGLSLTSPYRGEGVSAAWLAIAAGLWFAWVMVTGFGAGGYLCGRLRRRIGDATADEVTVRDGAHGLMVWATGALVGTLLATTGAGGFVVVGTAAVGSVADTAAEAASDAYFANLMLRGTATDPAAPADTGAAALTGQAAAVAPARTGGVDPAVQEEVAAIVARTAMDETMADRDRSYLSQVVAANTDLDPAAARARVDAVNAEIDEARATALAAVERARVAGVVFGFIAAATLLIGAIAAFFAAAAGGRHRDEGLGLEILTARR